MIEFAYGLPTVFGRGLHCESGNFVHPPFLVVTMSDLWPLFGEHFEGTDHILVYTPEKRTGRKFLRGQPVGLGAVVGSMLHEGP